MPVQAYSGGPDRTRVAITGEITATVAEAFSRRGFKCVPLTGSSNAKTEAAKTNCIIFTQIADQSKPDLRASLKKLAIWLNYGCRVYLRYSDKESVLWALNSLRLPPSGLTKTDGGVLDPVWFEGVDYPALAPFVHLISENEDWDTLANIVTQNPAGNVPNTDLQISVFKNCGSPMDLSDEDALLIRRAFTNYSEIRLHAKPDGLSGVYAFDSFAVLNSTVVGGKWPYRFFVKLGPRLEVSREYRKYREITLEHVPYYLGPRLRLDRCALSHKRGLIVSDYVSSAESLRDAAKAGRGVPAIANLFNITMLSWRRPATESEQSLGKFLREFFPKVIPEHRKKLMLAYGSKHTPPQLQKMLESHHSVPVLIGVIHGDLHATNVLVRSNDAIIIDMERIKSQMPLLYDAASLEGGLFVDGFIGDRRTWQSLLASIEKLYVKKAFDSDDNFCVPQDGSAWFFDCVRQIRMQARQMERFDHQYALTLATVLIKKGCNKDDFTPKGVVDDEAKTRLSRETVRALAYVLGERILLALSKSEGPTK